MSGRLLRPREPRHSSVNYLIQGIGILGLAFNLWSFQGRSQRQIVVLQVFGSLFWLIHFLMLGAMAGALLNFLGFSRAVVFANRSRPEAAWSRNPWWIAVFVAVTAVCCAASWGNDGPKVLLPFAGYTLTTFALAMPDPFRVRLLTLANNPCWLAYNLFSGSVSGVVSESLNIVSILVGMLRIDLPAYRARRKNASIPVPTPTGETL